MEDRQYKVLSIGAHPDDADTSAGGLLAKLHSKGWDVRLVSMTNGCVGHYDPQTYTEEKLAEARQAEAAKSGRILGGRYDVFNNPDGRLVPGLKEREELIRYIREYSPDLIITNRLNDYHPDHRNTAQLVEDASYLLTVPCLYPDCKAMEHMPVIIYWHDGFKRPYEFVPDIVVPVEDNFDTILQCACCHETQYFDWMLWPDNMDIVQWPREKKVERLAERFNRRMTRQRAEYDGVVRAKFGKDADKVGLIEVYEISEYGEEPSEELMELFEK